MNEHEFKNFRNTEKVKKFRENKQQEKFSELNTKKPYQYNVSFSIGKRDMIVTVFSENAEITENEIKNVILKHASVLVKKNLKIHGFVRTV